MLRAQLPVREGQTVTSSIPATMRASVLLPGRCNLDPHMRFYATPPVDGAFQEYLTMPLAFAHRVPDTMSIRGVSGRQERDPRAAADGDRAPVGRQSAGDPEGHRHSSALSAPVSRRR